MTELSSTAPDEGPLSFALWLPRWTPVGGVTRCRFEATRRGFDNLGGGTEEAMRQFLADLVEPAPLPDDLVVRDWAVTRYACPYFSDYPDEPEWEDRLPVTWAVQVDLVGTLPDPAHSGPIGTRAEDETSFEDAGGVERGRERVVVIGEPTPGADADGLDGLDGVTGVENLAPWGMVALDLGVLDLPARMDVVDSVLGACADRRLRTNWADAG